MSEQQWWQTDGENNEVATKRDLWQPIAERVNGFDLDPAAGCEPTPIATDRYTEADDGLTSPWYGTVWLNPPFDDKGTWYKRLVNQYRHGAVNGAVALATADVSTDWFHDWFSTADVITFLDGRDWYIADGDNPTFSTQVGVWNPTKELVEWLHTQGTVVEPQSDGKQATLF